MKSLKHTVTPTQIVTYTIPIAIITLIIVGVYNLWFDRRFKREGK